MTRREKPFLSGGKRVPLLSGDHRRKTGRICALEGGIATNIFVLFYPSIVKDSLLDPEKGAIIIPKELKV
jgi:hypothetical protein